jgi:hypothetical protein
MYFSIGTTVWWVEMIASLRIPAAMKACLTKVLGSDWFVRHLCKDCFLDAYDSASARQS